MILKIFVLVVIGILLQLIEVTESIDDDITGQYISVSLAPMIDEKKSSTDGQTKENIVRRYLRNGRGHHLRVRTCAPTSKPSQVPTSRPTPRTIVQTRSPTSLPTSAPTNSPTSSPTSAPTNSPTSLPTSAPTICLRHLSKMPSTSMPTVYNLIKPPQNMHVTCPTKVPTQNPRQILPDNSYIPKSSLPSKSPSAEPTTTKPSSSPTAFPTPSPTVIPTLSPTKSLVPSPVPTATPTTATTATPIINLPPKNRPFLRPHVPGGDIAVVPKPVQLPKPASPSGGYVSTLKE